MRRRAGTAVTKQKLKTHKGAKRRFKITATGKVMRAKGMKSHFRRRKAPRVLRQLDRMQDVHAADEKRVKRLLPYGV
jgi:large subunit ribosomal protein L35